MVLALVKMYLHHIYMWIALFIFDVRQLCSVHPKCDNTRIKGKVDSCDVEVEDDVLQLSEKIVFKCVLDELFRK